MTRRGGGDGRGGDDGEEAGMTRARACPPAADGLVSTPLRIYIGDVYPEDCPMKVARWGNSLAIRIPADVAAAIGLKEGDEVNVVARQNDRLEVEKDPRREEALRRLDELAKKAKFPPGWKFDRAEIYEERIRQLSK